MRGNNIGYHTRLYGNDSVKCVGGSFGGSLDLQTANRLVNAHFKVVVKPSGTPVFVDIAGREVILYVTVDPSSTDAGKLALAAHEQVRRSQQEDETRKRELIDSILDEMTPDEALRRLTFNKHDAILGE